MTEGRPTCLEADLESKPQALATLDGAAKTDLEGMAAQYERVSVAQAVVLADPERGKKRPPPILCGACVHMREDLDAVLDSRGGAGSVSAS